MTPVSGISKAEWLVMNRVWHHQKATAREVTEDLAGRTGWSYNTVKSMLERLAKKGWVDEQKVGGSCFYRPLIPRSQALRGALDEVLDRVLDGTFEPVLQYLGSKKLSQEDLMALEAILRRKGGKQGS